MIVAAGALPVAADVPHDFRVVLEQSGRSGLSVRLTDIAGNDYHRQFPAQVVLNIHDGKVRLLGSSDWTSTFIKEYPAGTEIPEFEVQGRNRWWPNDVTVIPSVAGVPGKKLVVKMAPPEETAVALSLIGGWFWSLIELAHERKRNRKKVLTALALGAAAGIVAFFTAESEMIWKFIGFEASPLRPQSYFLLGLAISVIGVRKLLQKITGASSDAPPLTADLVRQEMVTVLNSDAVRAPFRDEVRAIVFDDNYVIRHPHLIPRLEFALSAAKANKSIPDGLTDHVAPRLELLYSGSYRQNCQTRVSGTIDVPSRSISWTHSHYYELIQTGDEAAPEVKFSHVTHLPESLASLPPGRLKALGGAITSVRFGIKDGSGAVLLEYEGTEGEVLSLQNAVGATADAEMELAFGYDQRAAEVDVSFCYVLPPALRQTRKVVVTIQTESVSALEDGIIYQRMSKLTQGLHLQLEFNRAMELDIVEFEWRHPELQTTTIDLEHGAAHSTGWLLPGNGFCMAWSGTKALLGDVTNVPKTRSLVRRVLDFFGGRHP
jgi:hypothetical protein